MTSPKMDDSGLTRTPQYDKLQRSELDSNDLRAWKTLAFKLESALTEIPVMAGPAGMQKAYDKGFADGQDRTWKAAQANTSARPDSISEPTEQPRPTETSPASALRQDSSGGETFDQWWKKHGYDYGTYAMQVARNAWNAAPQESRSEVLERAVVEAAKAWLTKYEDEVRDPSEEAPCKNLVAALDALASRAEPGAPRGLSLDRDGDPLHEPAPEPSVDYARGWTDAREKAAQYVENFDHIGEGRALKCAKGVRSLKINAAEQTTTPATASVVGKPASAAPERIVTDTVRLEHAGYAPAAPEAFTRDYAEAHARGLAEGLEEAAKVGDPIIRRERGWEEENHVRLLLEFQAAIRAKIKPRTDEEAK